MLGLLIVALIYATMAQDPTPVADPQEFRNLVADLNTLQNSVSAAGSKIILTPTGENSGSASLDIAGFKFVADGINNQVAFGFSALSADANVDWTPNPNGQGSLIYSITGAWVEIISGFTHIFLYEERNNQDGLQYNLGDNVWDCDQDNGNDCILRNGLTSSIIDITQDLSFTPLNITKEACPEGNGYSPDCSVWTIFSIGRLQGKNVFTITLQVANQKVKLGEQEVGPDYAKLSWIIEYPYDAKGQTNNKDKANIAMAGYVGGKAGSGIVGGSFQGKDSFVFEGTNDKAAIFAWDPTATIGGTEVSNIFVNQISGQSIKDFDCSKCDAISLLVINLSWKPAVIIASAGGWTSDLFLISWPGVGAESVNYDPTIGMAAKGDYSTGAAAGLLPSMLTLLCSFIVYRLY